jgi:hypothetical protein
MCAGGARERHVCPDRSELIEERSICTGPSKMQARTRKTTATTAGTATRARAFLGLPALGETTDLASTATCSIVGPSIRPARPSRSIVDGCVTLAMGAAARRATAARINIARRRAMATVEVTCGHRVLHRLDTLRSAAWPERTVTRFAPRLSCSDGSTRWSTCRVEERGPLSIAARPRCPWRGACRARPPIDRRSRCATPHPE